MSQRSVRHGLLICLLLPFAGCGGDDAPASAEAGIAIPEAEKRIAEAATAIAKAATAEAATAKAATAKAAAEAAEKDPIKQFEKLATALKRRRQVTLDSYSFKRLPSGAPIRLAGRPKTAAEARAAKKTAIQFQQKLNKYKPLIIWRKTLMRVVRAKIDVKKTDSLVSPFSGFITVLTELDWMKKRTGPEDDPLAFEISMFKTAAEARAANIPGTTPISRPATFHFAYQNNKWVYKWVNPTATTEEELDKKEWQFKEVVWPFTPIKKAGRPVTRMLALWPSDSSDYIAYKEGVLNCRARQYCWRSNRKSDVIKNDNIMLEQQGTGKAYTLSRLERESPELFERACLPKDDPQHAANKDTF